MHVHVCISPVGPVGVALHGFSALIRYTSTGETHLGGQTCSLPGTEQPQPCLICALCFFSDPPLCLVKQIKKLTFSILWWWYWKKKKSGEPFYSIYEKERVMSSAMVNNL